jgi:hypothetical protein
LHPCIRHPFFQNRLQVLFQTPNLRRVLRKNNLF